MHELRGQWNSRMQRTLGTVLPVLACALGFGAPAGALPKFGPLEISGNLETRNLVRHSSVDSAEFIQNRNTFRLRVDYEWLERGQLLSRFEVPFLARSKLFLLYRGVYDGFYDLAPGDTQHGQTRFDDLVGGRITDLSREHRTGLKFENHLREAYIDLRLKDAPLSFRLGRQQVIWGESDQFRIMDIWNPLNITWHFQQESWDEIRVPLWLGKGLWDIGQLGPFSNTFVEVVYNPFDFQSGIKADYLPRPWALPFPNPLRPGQVQLNNDVFQYLSPQFNLKGSFRKGDFQRNPQDASEVGARFHVVTPQGVETSLNYLYGRGRGVGGTSPFGLKITRVTLPYRSTDSPTAALAVGQFSDGRVSRPAFVLPVLVDAEVVHPYMHIFGLTGNYFEDRFTQAVLRWESAYVLGEPFQTVAPDRLVNVTYSDGIPVGDPPTKSPLGFTKRDLWAGMIGFDRPTWIRWLNPRATWFLTGQFFWTYTTGDVRELRGNSGVSDEPYFTPENPNDLGGSTNGFGTWVSGPFAGQMERLQNANVPGNGDDIRRWEHLVTVGATTFYRGGTVVPFLANAWDPVNGNNETLWHIQYFYTNNLIFELQQKFYYTYGSKLPSNDPWYAGGRFHRRDETGVKVTYQF